MKRHGRADIFVTDKLRSYSAAMKEICNADRQETGRWLDSKAENSHQPFRRRERAMPRFRRMRSSPPTAPQSTPISTWNAIFTADQISS